MKKCPMCAEMVQDDARVCRFCKHAFDKSAVPPPPRKPIGCGGAIAIGILAPVVAYPLLREDKAATALSTPAAQPTIAAADVAKCREFLKLGETTGIIRGRPAPNRVNVEDSLWAQMDAQTKDRLLQAVSCDLWSTAMPGADDYVVAYGHRSGKRLQMLTSVGMNRE